jgi:NodT family efflux transporter outer membrane factor (OMF) lipoprotein
MALPANMPAEFIGRRADVVAARWRVEAAARNIDNAKAQFYPNVNLAAAVGLISLEDRLLFKTDSLDESAGPALSLPIFQTSLRANLRSRDAEYDAAVEAYNATVIDSVKDVADQIASTRSILRQQGEEALALEKTEQAYALARQRYEAGLGNYLTVLTAETIVLQQRRADAELKARVLDTNVQLVRALGGGFVATPALAQASPSMNSGASK